MPAILLHRDAFPFDLDEEFIFVLPLNDVACQLIVRWPGEARVKHTVLYGAIGDIVLPDPELIRVERFSGAIVQQEEEGATVLFHDPKNDKGSVFHFHPADFPIHAHLVPAVRSRLEHGAKLAVHARMNDLCSILEPSPVFVDNQFQEGGSIKELG